MAVMVVGSVVSRRSVSGKHPREGIYFFGRRGRLILTCWKRKIVNTRRKRVKGLKGLEG